MIANWIYLVIFIIIAYVVTTPGDDDDDRDGGMMVPAYQQKQWLVYFSSFLLLSSCQAHYITPGLLNIKQWQYVQKSELAESSWLSQSRKNHVKVKDNIASFLQLPETKLKSVIADRDDDSWTRGL